MISLTLDTAAAFARIVAMQNNITQLQSNLPTTMVAWQAEDLNRKRPRITRLTKETVETNVIQRSNKRRRRRRGTRKITDAARAKRDAYWSQRTRAQRAGTPGRQGVRRSILRPHLLQQLHERYRTMLADTVKWR